MNIAAVIRVGEKGHGTRKLGCQIGRKLRQRYGIGGRTKLFDPGIRTQIDARWLLAGDCRRLQGRDMLVHQTEQPCIVAVGRGVDVFGEKAL